MRDGGLLTYYALTNTATAGFMPVEKLVSLGTAYYAHVTTGVTRLYAAIGANREYNLVVRTYNEQAVPNGAAYVILEDGLQYRIDQANPIVDEDAVELTLVRLEDFYDVAS